MPLKPLLTCASFYLAAIGLGMMFVPRQLGIGAVPADAPPALIAYLRIFGGPMVGIAVLDWLAREAEPSPARRAIIVANAVGFVCVAAMDVWGVFGGTARPVAKIFLVVHLLFAVGFVLAARRQEA
jgi:quinol-cytochrome oxidoreductase complex cytochrome b subunit